MDTYIILSRLTDEGAERIKEHPERIKAVNQELDALDVHIKEQYAVLGAFDFVTIVEAPNVETVLRAVNEIAARGRVRVQTMRAVPMDKFTSIFEHEGTAAFDI
jgi:uncharacterized protein with GYD domain